MTYDFESTTCTVPEWAVIDRKGRTVGTVHGVSERDALTSAKDDTRFDSLDSFTVRRVKNIAAE